MEGLSLHSDASPMTTTENDPMLSSAAPESNSRCIQTRSGNLSRSPVAPVSMSGIVDSAEFRCQVPEPTYHTLNGRMSPSGGAIVCQPLSTPGYASSSYTTLTPLQPLPPISTVTPCEKFTSQVSSRQNNNSPGPMNDSGGRSNGGSNGGFAPFFQSNNSLNFPLSGIQAAYNVNIKYEYDMKPNEAMHMHHVETTGNGMSMSSSSPSSTVAPLTPTQYGSLPPVSCAMQQQQLITHNAPQHVMFHGHGSAPPPYASTYSSQSQVIELRAPKQEPKLFSAGNGFDAYGATVDSVLMSSTGNGGSINDVNGMGSSASSQVADSPFSLCSSQEYLQTPVQHHQPTGGGSSRKKSAHNHQADSTADMEELNTKDLAQRISAELKRYSIPQAIFAQRVLCRSQGTLSDLLRNPKPWSKLKSGRETFRRMFKWLQEPEFQRMSALRLAGQFFLHLSRSFSAMRGAFGMRAMKSKEPCAC
jgi:hypothetical protein